MVSKGRKEVVATELMEARQRIFGAWQSRSGLFILPLSRAAFAELMPPP